MSADRPSSPGAAGREPTVPSRDRLAARFTQRRSPLEGLEIAPGLTAPQPWGMVVVHGAEPATSTGASAALSLGPSRWLAVHEAEPDRGSLVDLHGGAAVAEDLSSGLVQLRVAGPDARTRVASGVAVDLHRDAFPTGSSAVTAYRDVSVVLHASEDDTLDLYVLRSFARTLWRWVGETGVDRP